MKTLKHLIPAVLITAIVSCILIFQNQGDEESELFEQEENGVERNQKYMEGFYLPKTMEEVTQERNDYLNQYGSFKNLSGTPTDNSLPWSSVGPYGILLYNPTTYSYYSGRIISFAMHGDNTNILYCGGASGGLWKSTNAGASWFNLLDTLSCPTVSSIAVSYLSSDNTVWFSTGTPFGNGAGMQLGRVYKSTNGGTSWSWISSIGNVGWVSKIEVNIFNKNHVYVGTNVGLLRTTNGNTFTNVLTGPISSVITYTNFILPDTLNVLAGMVGTGIYRTTNGGANFSLAVLPSFNAAVCSRINLANDKGTGKTAALISKNNGKFLGVWTTSDRGATWNQRTLPTSDSGGQSWYNSAVAVAPNGRITVGYNRRGIFYSATDGVSWSPSNPTHEDIHILYVYNNTLMFHGSDAGIYKSTNQAVDWNDAGGNWLPLSQSYTLTADATDPGLVWSGLQDDGVIEGYDGFLRWTNLTCCDGGDYIRAGSYQYMSLVGLGDNSLNRYQRKLITAPPTDPWEGFCTGLPDGQPWSNSGMNRIKYSNGSFYTHLNQFAFKTNGTSLPWSMIGLRPHPTSDVWVGKILPISGFVLVGFDISTTPQVRRYDNSTNLWGTPDLTAVPAGVKVSDFDSGSAAGRVFMTVTGTTGARVFRSTNSGASWVNITGNLPANVNARCILTNKSNDNIIYIGTDFGVYVSGTGGALWYNFSTGLPSVCYINALQFDASSNFLYAATYGRGVFKSSVLTSAGNLSEVAGEYELGQNYPNPFNPVTNIEFNIPKQGNVKITVFDVNGRAVRTLIDDYRQAGKHKIQFDASRLSSGIYIYKIEAGEFTDSKKLILIK
jgi:type IX secretion system substrate protein